MIERMVLSSVREILDRLWSVALIRFLVVGGTTYGLYMGLYVVITRSVVPWADRATVNVACTVISSVYNAFLHKTVTFRSSLRYRSIFWRYVLVFFSCIAIQGIGFWFMHTVLGWHDVFVGTLLSLLIPFYTFFMHHAFTFRDE